MGGEATTTTVPHGRAVAEAVRDVIRQVKADDPMAPVTVAVHSAWAGLSLRRLLASGSLGPVAGARPGLVNVSFITIARVAELLGAPTLARAGRRPLPAAVRTEAVRGALQAEPGMFSHAARHPSTVLALDRTYEELRRCPDAAVDALIAAGQRAAEVVRICRSARARLAGWYDETDLAEAAVAALESGGATAAVAELGHVVAAGLEPLPPALFRMVAGLSELQPQAPTVIATAEGPADNPAAQATAVITCPDPDEEVRAVVRRIAGQIDAGVALHRMAILYPNESYAQVIHQQLAGAGLPFSGPGIRRLSDTPAGAALAGLLEMAEGDLRRNEVMDWLASAPILDTDGQLVPSTAWDRVSKVAGVVGGMEQWDARLEAFASASMQRADEFEGGGEGGEEWKAAAARRDAELAAGLRTFVSELIERLTVGLPGDAPWSDWCAWACATLERYLGSAFKHGAWPDSEQEAFVSVLEALQSLVALDELGHSADISAFRSAAAQALQSPAGRVGRFGDGVLVGPLHQGRGLDLDAVWVVGMSEGYMPGTGGAGGVVLEEDRASALEAAPPPAGTRTLETRHTRQRRQAASLEAALAAAGASRTLSWSRSELRSARPHLPSRWLLAAASAMTDRWVGLEDLLQLCQPEGDPRFTSVVSFASGLSSVGDREAPASLHDRDVAELSRWVNGRGGRLEQHPIAHEGPAAAYAATATERNSGFSAFSGRVDPSRLVMRRRHSATKLETWAACPFRWFLGEALRLSHDEPPEDLIQISARDKGLLVHEILEDYIRAVLAGEPRSLETALRIATEAFARYEAKGVTGKSLLWHYDREVIRRELETFVSRDHLEPIAAELSFGRGPNDNPPVEIDVNGERIPFSGSADRVDRDGRGLVVTDYKTGGSDSFAGLKDDPVLRGTKLQLHIYARAARQVHGDEHTPVKARYWFVSEKGKFDEAAVDLDRDAPRFDEALQVITDGIKQGLFPARPGEDGFYGFENCGYCDFRKLCPVDRDRRWERTRSDPALRAYRELAEPDVEDEAGAQ
ncbi:MAG TPA: PD-(D/E)XK nuclease family protein [Acidimicrobiales bacterium]|nr:PD-(D/E)XK nuclease family protein [Acidimicrobiales bacterium]